jgi:hypothetical protein
MMLAGKASAQRATLLRASSRFDTKTQNLPPLFSQCAKR